MKNVSQRDALFLAEMGIGPLWQMRTAPESEATEAPADAGAAAVVEEPPAQPAAVQAEADAFAPQPALAPAPAPAPRAHTPLSAPPYRNPPAEPVEAAWDDDTPVEEAAPDVSTMDWTALRAAILDCKHCSACGEGRKPVLGSGPRQARWLVAAGTPNTVDEAAGQLLSGDPGKLLDNMLHAVGLSRERDVYVTPLVKCRPTNAKGGERAPSAEEVAACRPFLERELALSGARTVLTLGQVAANGLLGRPLQEPLAGLRGQTHRFGAKPLVTTLHPGELLRRGADKALAWADLCRARSLDAGD
ncbi:uracil-DNA glycosylase [Massilia sp.]|uniref:uracil-DNA glycosylase n=1 Tax=Massilia sp. TaxID=1882437 RepID=UPI0028971564|nr:uracil-DNA glycosylase [Massilia sp.]